MHLLVESRQQKKENVKIEYERLYSLLVTSISELTDLKEERAIVNREMSGLLVSGARIRDTSPLPADGKEPAEVTELRRRYQSLMRKKADIGKEIKNVQSQGKQIVKDMKKVQKEYGWLLPKDFFFIFRD